MNKKLLFLLFILTSYFSGYSQCTAIANNNVSYTNVGSGTVNVTVPENGNATFTAPANTYFSVVNFASYGTPNGTAPNFTIGACHSANSQSRTESRLLGFVGSVVIAATNGVFGDPCVNTLKRYYVTASYVQPICNGSTASIVGTTPTGGNGTYTYQWESSTTSATAGFGNAVGVSTGVSYTSAALTRDTWFRRVVRSCSGSSTNSSAVVFVRVNTVTAGSIGNPKTICSGSTPATLSSTAAGTGSGTISYEWQKNESGSYVTIPGATAATFAPPALTTTTSYQRRTVSVFSGITCFSAYSTPVTISVSTVVTAGSIGNAQTICNGSTPATLSSTAAGTGSGTISYEWQTNASGSYVTVSGATAASFAPPALTTTTSYQRRTVSTFNGVNCYSAFTSPITISVNATVTAGSIGNTQTICSGFTPAALNSTAAGTGSGTISYEWQSNASGSYETIPDATTATFAPPALTRTTSYQRRTVSVFNGVTCYSAYTTPVTITVTAVTGDQVSFGNDSWIGYVYTSPDPANSNFSSNFVGSVNQPEIFDLNLGTGPLTSANLCGSYNDNFAIRFKMTKNFPAGCYTFTVGGDDGYRLSINGAPFLVEDWSEKPYVSTSGTIYLSGNTDLVLEYYERFGESRVSFLYTFQALNIPAVVSITQPNCTLGTGSVTLSGLPAGSWDLTQSGFAGATISGSGSQRTINGLAPGTYYYTVTSGSCTSNLSQAVVINPVQTTTFNGAGWSSTPTLDKLGIITAPTASPINLSQSIELCSCQVSSGTNVVVDEGIVLKLQDRLVVNPTGSLTFNNNSSLVQINDGANNSGSISYLRQTTVVRKAVDYTYWSSPVAGQNLLAVSPNTNQGRFWSFTPGGTWFVETPSTKIMDIGKGYIIRAPDFFDDPMNPPSSVFEATFTGQPNNGTVPVGVAGTFNLIGNPYPSAIDAIEFLEANQSVLNGTIYFWTHNTAIRDAQGTSNEGTGDLVYIQDDYASFNRTGGVATAPATTEPDLAFGNPRIPTGMIAAGQSFFASRLAGSSGNTVLFNNNMRLGVGNSSLDNSQFFRTTGTSKKENESTRNRIWLNVTNKQKAFKQILVGYLNGATNDFDPAFDGATYNANTIINFYSMLGTRRLSIQGRALPFDTADLVPLGYNAFIDGEFSISIDNVDGLFSSQVVYLEDKVKNTVHNLKTGPYTFQTVKGAFNDRFVLRYTDRTLGVDDLELKDGQVVLSVKNKQLKVTSTADAIKDVYIYDLLGKLIFVKKNIGTDEFLVSNLASSEQVLIVKTVLQNEVVSNLKTIYR